MSHAPKTGHDHHPSPHAHRHAHAHDRGWAGFARYALNVRRMWRSAVSDAVVAQIAPQRGERVVEIGSGMGAAMIVAARTGAEVVAIDPTPYMRRILGLRRLAQAGRSRIRVVDGAAENIPAADGSVDALWSVNTMHHWADLDRALAEAHRVLRPGGRLLLVDEDFDDPAHPSHAAVGRRHARHGHEFAVIEPVAVAEKLAALGFSATSGAAERIAGRPAKVVRGVKR